MVAEGADKEPESVPYEPPNMSEDDSSSTSSEKSRSESPTLNNRAAVASNGHSDVDEGTDSVPPSSPPPANPPLTDLLMPLDQPVPPIWITKEEDYLAFNPTMISHMSSDFFVDPDFTMGTGTFRLFWISGSTTRKGALNIMSTAGSGTHINLPEVFRLDVKAFRLEPLSPPGILTVDGEKIPYGPIQAQVHPRLARLMSRKRKS